MNRTLCTMSWLLTSVMCLSWSASHAQAAFELAGWTPKPATRTVWTRWLNTFDFRNGAGDADYYRGSYFRPCRPSNYRTLAEGRFGLGAPVYTVRDKRTQMTYYMGANCPTWHGTVELFVRSRKGQNIWNDSKEHHVLHLFGPRPVRGLIGQPSVSLVKTSNNDLEYQCQGTTIGLPVAQLKADEWYHLAISWDAKILPGRLWLTINGKGVTGAAAKPLLPLSYGCLVIGNSPREVDKVYVKGFGDWPRKWPRLHKDKPGDTDIYPLEGVIDEMHISDETLADRLPARRAELEALPVDWALYQQVEDAVRMILYRLWPNDLPLDTQVGNKYGGVTRPGWSHLLMYEVFGDQWFLDQAKRIGQVVLKAQRPEGHFPTAVKLESSGREPGELGPIETGLKSVGPASWSKPKDARIQDGFQDVPMAYLVYLHRLTGKREYLDAARRVGDLFIAAQNPNGSWSGEYDVETAKGHIADNKKILQGGEFDDGAIRRPFWSLLLLYHVTEDEKYLRPLVKCADWVLEAEIVNPEVRGWAAFYDAQNNPIQARVHEIPKIASRVFPGDVGYLMQWAYFLTGDRRYLDGIRPALKWYQEHRTSRGWAAFYENDGTPITPSNWYSGAGWYGPEYGHFTDITYIEEALAQLDKGTLRPQRGTLKPSPEAIEKVRAGAIERLRDPELVRRVRRDVQLAPNAQWVRNRPRYKGHLYGIQAYGNLDKMIEYLVAARIAAKKVPSVVLVTGAPVPEGAPIAGSHARCWFVEDWFDTSLRRQARLE